MELIATPQQEGLLAPIDSQERIQALDVIRGFALFGIFLMNVEWFNRPIESMSQGMPIGLTGVNWLASWFVYNFVQGKFWTVFSLVFGMGFAVMLTRAERAERDFLRPYLRRIAALAVFGAAHHILIWGGDILFSYAVGALALLILLYGTWKYILAALVVTIGLGFIPKLAPVWAVSASLALVGLLALYLRGERRMHLRGRRVLVFSFVFLLLGSLAAMAAATFWALPNGPKGPRIPLTVASLFLLAIGLLSDRYHNPVESRTWRLGAATYLLPFLLMTVFGVAQFFRPPAPVAQPAAAQVADSKVPLAAKDKKPARKSEAELKAERDTDRAKRVAKQEEKVRAEAKAMAKGSYAEFMQLRARNFVEKAPENAGFASVLIGMFLLGVWFVRSGVMADTAAHLPLFRKLALYGLPLGIGLGLVGSSIAPSYVPGQESRAFQVANGLSMLGNLPASLGYVSLVVLALHSDSAFSRIRVLAPAGRMALTSYLTQSMVCSMYFFGYGMGQIGMGRARQLVWVAVVFTLQVVFSHWWLGRFRYGPMEWLWRTITYWQTPPMRLETAESKPTAMPVEVH